ncbi:MAG TPA: tetratricopeptide repeat protein [Streptosporangiaceae bacterium]|nr:tetratricopeptide repeat protein [Streptosporangiaceae bacterium]
MATIAAYLGASGSYAAARDLHQRVVDARVPGAEDPDTLAARANLASFTGLAGDAAGARDQYAALLPLIERVQGAEHPDHAGSPRQPRRSHRVGGGCGRGP